MGRTCSVTRVFDFMIRVCIHVLCMWANSRRIQFTTTDNFRLQFYSEFESYRHLVSTPLQFLMKPFALTSLVVLVVPCTCLKTAVYVDH